jgi:UV excision repair protein RAD23
VISQMETMGFDRADIDRAMRAAYYNPDRAVDYLLNGIPESVQAEQRQAAAARTGAQAGGGSTAAGGGAAATATATGETQPASTATSAQAANPGPDSTATDEPINLFEAAAQAGGRGGGAAAGQAGGAGARSAGGTAGLGGAPTNLDFLRNNPHFQQLRQHVQQQPNTLEFLLQQVAESNPQLAQLIQQNQESFLQMLGEVSFDILYNRWSTSV